MFFYRETCNSWCRVRILLSPGHFSEDTASVYLSTYSIYLSIYLSIYISIYLSIHLFICHSANYPTFIIMPTISDNILFVFALSMATGKKQLLH